MRGARVRMRTLAPMAVAYTCPTDSFFTYKELLHSMSIIETKQPRCYVVH